MTTKRDKPPTPIVMKTPRGLSPVAAYDQELLMDAPMGAQFELVRRNRRLWPQLKLYWATLGQVAKATGRWPTAEHLSEELKLVCGFARSCVDWKTGEVLRIPDSVALHAMSEDDFGRFFEMAMAALSDHIGYDPLAYSVAA
jgi:hypothetical protein